MKYLPLTVWGLAAILAFGRFEALAETGQPVAASGETEREIERGKSKADLREPVSPSLDRRVSDLEREIVRLEDEIDFLSQKIRNLDRRVDDLRYRHV
jgi:predicted RNase H-like nuclease (RuvC/YqgF family)